MEFLSLEPFIPSGNNFEKSKEFFQELGFKINWDADDYIGFERDGCKFILQNFDNIEFAQNFMLSVRVSNVNTFWKDVTARKLSEKFKIKISKPIQQPYGKEVNIIDIAGVCWHFIE
jgi:hypothetical protein